MRRKAVFNRAERATEKKPDGRPNIRATMKTQERNKANGWPKPLEFERELDQEHAEGHYEGEGQLSSERPSRCFADCSDHPPTPG